MDKHADYSLIQRRVLSILGSGETMIHNLGSLISGVMVGFVVMAYLGPFLAIIGMIASIIATVNFMLRMIIPKKERTNVKPWG